MIKYELHVNSFQNWMEEKKMKMLDFNFYLCTNNPSRSIYTSPFVYLRGCLVLQRGNQPNFWHTHWICTQWIPNQMVFGPNAIDLKFLRLFLFSLSDLNWFCFGFNLLNGYILFLNSWEVSPRIKTFQYFDLWKQALISLSDVSNISMSSINVDHD